MSQELPPPILVTGEPRLVPERVLALQTLAGCPIEADLLELALTHPSAVGEGLDRTRKSNQRLEFLGDAMLGAIVAAQLYAAGPDEPEGVLTARRIFCVRGETLATAARRLDLGAHLIFGRGEEFAGGRERNSNLAEAFEALVGAVFLTGGWAAANAFVLRALAPELTAPGQAVAPAKNRLQEKTQAARRGTPSYRTGVASGRAGWFAAQVLLEGAVVGSGTGPSKKAAEEAAASAALEGLEQEVLPPPVGA